MIPNYLSLKNHNYGMNRGADIISSNYGVDVSSFLGPNFAIGKTRVIFIFYDRV